MGINEIGAILILLSPVLLIAVITFAFRVFRLVWRMGDSGMQPTLHSDDSVIFAPITRKKLKRYWAVAFLPENRKGGMKNRRGGILLRRVIGLPGETVQIKDGYVYINGERLSGDGYGKIDKPGIAKNAITLGVDEYFLLGDNRNNFRDSRKYGPIRRDRIGRQMLIHVSPFTRRNKYYYDQAKHYFGGDI